MVLPVRRAPWLIVGCLGCLQAADSAGAPPVPQAEDGPTATAEPMPAPAAEAVPARDRLSLLRTLAEAAEEGSRRRHGRMPFTPEAPVLPMDPPARILAEAVVLYRRIHAARAGWHGGLAAWRQAWSEPGPVPELAPAADAVARCAADVLVEAMTATANVLLDPIILPDHPVVKAQRPVGGPAIAAAWPSPRGDAVTLLPIATLAPEGWPTLASWRVLGPYPAPVQPLDPRVEIPLGAELPGIPYRVGTGPALEWRPLADPAGRIEVGGSTGTVTSRFHAVTEIETVLGEERWLRLESPAALQVWLDGRVAWSGPGPVAVELKVQLARGRHRLRIDGAGPGQIWFRAAVSTRSLHEVAAMTVAAADAILAQVPPRWSLDAPQAPPIAGSDAAIPLARTHWRTSPPRWLVAGPLPHEPEPGPSTWRPQLDQPVPGAGVPPAASVSSDPASRWRLPAPGQLRHGSGRDPTGLYARLIYQESVVFDLPALLPAKTQGIVYLATQIDNDRLRLVKVLLKGPGIRFWLDGRLQPAEALVHLHPGRHLLLLGTSVRGLPPAILARATQMTVGLHESETPVNSLHRAWLDRVRPMRPELLRIVRGLPGTRQAADAALALDALLESELDIHD